ncbi:MAG: response regulator [Thermoproteota archaeon]|nr:response regulator [Thermoproteota archaeon]
MSGNRNRDNRYSDDNAQYGHGLSQKEDASDEGDNNGKPLAKLLIVDDDPDIVQVLQNGLRRNKFLVNAFTNPDEALQAFKSDAESYCLVVSDVRMPRLSGIQLARKVKEVNPNVKVVLMTAFEIRENEFSKVFPSIHIDGFVQKPIGIRDLTNKILGLVGKTKRRLGQ